MKFTADEIFQHMAPATIAAWVADMDNAPDEMDDCALMLMNEAIIELFALVGMEAVSILQEAGVPADSPAVMTVIESYNEDGE